MLDLTHDLRRVGPLKLSIKIYDIAPQLLVLTITTKKD